MNGAQLRRELSVWEAIGLSLALMAPSMAANINPQGTAGSVGRAVPLAFALATVGVLLIAYTFVRLCQRFNHAGSVYGFVGATLGPRAGVVAGWALLGTYVFYGVVTSTAAGIFGTAIFGGVYFVFVTAVEVMGFGTDDAGVAAFTASSSLLGDLGTQYVASWVGHLITIGAAISAFGCALACAVSASRLLFALSRDGVGPGALAQVSATRGT